jgi:hypothetical protein
MLYLNMHLTLMVAFKYTLEEERQNKSNAPKYLIKNYIPLPLYIQWKYDHPHLAPRLRICGAGYIFAPPVRFHGAELN